MKRGTAERDSRRGGIIAMDTPSGQASPDQAAPEPQAAGPAPTTLPHPNELDRRRVERALKDRKRYRYVTPEVRGIPGGYEIISACCSRNVDPEGGIVDIALMLFQPDGSWNLYRKDHGTGQWVRHGGYPSLPKILELLKEDPERKFWQ